MDAAPTPKILRGRELEILRVGVEEESPQEYRHADEKNSSTDRSAGWAQWLELAKGL